MAAFVSSVSSGPLGMNRSQQRSIISRASRIPGRASISLRPFGSNEIVPPWDFTCSAARLAASISSGENRDEPMTCRCAQSESRRSPSAAIRVWPQALCLMLNTKSRSPSVR